MQTADLIYYNCENILNKSVFQVQIITENVDIRGDNFNKLHNEFGRRPVEIDREEKFYSLEFFELLPPHVTLFQQVCSSLN
jgi:hypothetical protein